MGGGGGGVSLTVCMCYGSCFVTFYDNKTVFPSVADKVAVGKMLFWQLQRALVAALERWPL